MVRILAGRKSLVISPNNCFEKHQAGDFPGGPVVKNPPSNAGDKEGSIPGQETKIPHAAEQLSPRSAATEPVCSGACSLQRRLIAAKKF